MTRAYLIYHGSDAEATKQFYQDLSALGPKGIVAMNLLRAQKASSRAKVYRGGIGGKGSFRRMAYDKKQWSIDQLCTALIVHRIELQMIFGWKQDPNVLFDDEPSWVLYVDLPNGQVSFHSPQRGEGPEYPGKWDGKYMSEERVIEYCNKLFEKDR